MRFTHRHQPIDEARLLLAVPPHARHGLVVVGRVPVRVEHHQAVGADQVQAAPARLGGEQEQEVAGGRIVETLHHLL